MNKILMMTSIGLLSLGGCSSYKEQFDCPVKNGMACSSLSKVNHEIDKGNIDIHGDMRPIFSEADNDKKSKDDVLIEGVETTFFGSEFAQQLNG